ncbi:hypothetical protein GVAV_000384 [Gurleya vavrai]
MKNYICVYCNSTETLELENQAYCDTCQKYFNSKNANSISKRILDDICKNCQQISEIYCSDFDSFKKNYKKTFCFDCNKKHENKLKKFYDTCFQKSQIPFKEKIKALIFVIFCILYLKDKNWIVFLIFLDEIFLEFRPFILLLKLMLFSILKDKNFEILMILYNFYRFIYKIKRKVFVMIYDKEDYEKLRKKIEEIKL